MSRIYLGAIVVALSILGLLNRYLLLIPAVAGFEYLAAALAVFGFALLGYGYRKMTGFALFGAFLVMVALVLTGTVQTLWLTLAFGAGIVGYAMGD